MGWRDAPVVSNDGMPAWAKAPAVGDDDPSAAKELAQGTGLGMRAIVKGALAFPTMALDAGIGIGNLVNRATNAIGWTDAAQFPSASSLNDKALSAVGLPEPATPTQRVASDVLGAATGSGVIAKGAEKLAQNLAPGIEKQVVARLGEGQGMQVASGASSGLAGGVTREMGGSEGAQLAASLLGGFVPGLATAGGAATLRGTVRGGEAGRTQYNDRLQTFEDAGVDPSAGQASGTRRMQAAESGLSRVPGGAGPMAAQAEAEAKQMQVKVNQIADSLIPNANATKAGLTVEKGLNKFVDRFKAEQNFLYGKLDQYIPPDTLVPANNVLSKIAEITTPIAGAEKTSGIIQTPRVGAIGDALASDAAAKPPQNIVSSIVGADGKPIVTGQTAGSPGGMPYEAIKRLRTAIGEKITNPSLTDDVSTAQWKQVYGALSEDMGAAAQQAGPDAERAFNRANWYTRAGHDRIESTLDRVSGKDTAEKVYQAAVNPSEVKEGATTISAVLRSLNPEERNVVSAATIKRMGQANPSAQDAEGMKFSTETFLTNWNKISEPAKMVLFADTNTRTGLEALAKSASYIREGSKVFANPSGTSAAGANIAVGTAAVLNPLLVTKIAAGIAAANGASRLMTNQNFVRWVGETTRLSPGMLPGQIQSLVQMSQRWPDADKAEVQAFVTGASGQR